jgi:hypothetical protein
VHDAGRSVVFRVRREDLGPVGWVGRRSGGRERRRCGEVSDSDREMEVVWSAGCAGWGEGSCRAIIPEGQFSSKVIGGGAEGKPKHPWSSRFVWTGMIRAEDEAVGGVGR